MYQVVIQREFEHIGMYIYNISETWEYNYRQAFWQPKDKIELYVGTYTYNIFQIEKETIRSWEQQAEICLSDLQKKGLSHDFATEMHKLHIWWLRPV